MTRQSYEPYVSIGSWTARRGQRAFAVAALGAVIAVIVWMILSNGGAAAHHHVPGALHLRPSASTRVESTRAAAVPLVTGAAVRRLT